MSSLTSRVPAGKPAVPAAPPNPIDDVLARCNAALMPAGARLFLRAALLSLECRPERRPGGDLHGLASEVLSRAIGKDFWPAAVEAHRAYFESISLIRVDKLLRGTIASDMPADARAVLHALAGHANERHEAWPQRETIAGEAGVSVRRLDAILRELVAKRWVRKEAQHRPDRGQTSSLYLLHPERGLWWSAASRVALSRVPPPSTRRH